MSAQIRITPWGLSVPALPSPGADEAWVLRTEGLPQKPMVPGLSAPTDNVSATCRPPNAVSSTGTVSHRCDRVTVRSSTVVSSPPAGRTETRKVTGASSIVPTARSSRGRLGRPTSYLIASGERATSVSW